jgi:2-polyprenyl-3-methyl-5-hydroxy-6-metoxy-1,4-benzoquinol methylase
VKLLSADLPRQASKISEALGKFLVEPGPSARVHRSIKVRSRTSSLRELARAKEQQLWKTKLAHRPKSFWYPYPTLRNIPVLERVLAGTGLNLLELCRGKYDRVADIGAADGDLAFFLEELGFSVDAIDNEFTNFNKLDGARVVKAALNSSVSIRSIDLDSRCQSFVERYDAVFLLGVLYHLKNPFSILERLSHVARYCFLTTRIARQTADGLPLSKHPLAYLLGPEECNNDGTNFWIFSDDGLKRLIQRSGWSIVAFSTIGDTDSSTPADPNHDERAICLLESDAVFELSAFPNPVAVGKEIGQTTIRWSTPDACPGKVYVSIDGKAELLFAGGRKGVAAANWIEAGSTYEFRLYDSERTRLFDKISVTTAIE